MRMKNDRLFFSIPVFNSFAHEEPKFFFFMLVDKIIVFEDKNKCLGLDIKSHTENIF